MSYFDEKGIIRSDLLEREASKQAEKFVVYRKDYKTGMKKVDDKKSLSSAQLRKFFNEFRQLEKKVGIKGFDKVKPLIKMVKSKAAYASNRSNSKFTASFKNFLITNVDRIEGENDFQAFMLHFEAVVGFFYGIEGVKNN
ncbi:MAG: type III-A CRISPR-associated protein Csm2 [Deltaproteobacteria bacterium]|jgi:CRISPR-associated protein Csm2|nr:type III-A CRISPR-associated protein Csm2 [Deltaproteobacteria bacterium]MDL1987973.1 type III-A CRISPR-associated protein Csm2 [Deltaproteobacteria bacterium]